MRNFAIILLLSCLSNAVLAAEYLDVYLENDYGAKIEYIKTILPFGDLLDKKTGKVLGHNSRALLGSYQILKKDKIHFTDGSLGIRTPGGVYSNISSYFKQIQDEYKNNIGKAAAIRVNSGGRLGAFKAWDISIDWFPKPKD